MPKKAEVSTELDFLTSLEGGEVVTQVRLSKRIAVSVGLINALLKRARHKGHVKAKAAPYKRYAYYLTPKGFAEKSRLVGQYLEHSLAFFRSAREEYVELFSQARARGMRRIAFAGAGDLAEIALMAANEVDIEVQFIFDPETNKDRLCGLSVVRNVEKLLSVDGVAVTAMQAPQQVFTSISGHLPDGQILTPALLRITRTPLNFRPKKMVRQ